MGVPVLGRRGERFLSHICESLLHAARLPDWIAADDDAYVAKAVAFAGNPAELAVLRTTLRAQVLASPLCDARRFARHFEDALHAMWARHVEAAPGASS
jgi:predicted O-linked N-acetylglucosamine transferase (SPINDLY family)